MRKAFALLLLFFATSILHAQYKVRFVVTETSALKHDSIFITGTFNNWNPAPNAAYLMKPDGANKKSIVLLLRPGKIEYKYTRGSWLSVEKYRNSQEVSNHSLIVRTDTTITDSVEAWRDELVLDNRYALLQKMPDSARINILTNLALIYAYLDEYYNADSALAYTRQAIDLLKKTKASAEGAPSNYELKLINLQEVEAGLLHELDNYTKALELRLDNLKRSDTQKDKSVKLKAISNIILDYSSMKDYSKMLEYGKMMEQLLPFIPSSHHEFGFLQWMARSSIAEAYNNLNRLDSALYYAKGLYNDSTLNGQPGWDAYTAALLGDIYSKKNDETAAFSYYRRAILYGIQSNTFLVVAPSQKGIAKLFQKKGQLDSALFYARQSLATLQNQVASVRSWGENVNRYIADVSPLIADLYKENNQLDSAYKYLHLSVVLKDSLYNADKIRQFQTITFNEAARQQQMQQQVLEEKRQLQTRVKIYSLLAGLCGVLIIAFLLYRNNKHKQKVNILLQEQKKEIEATLAELKATQAQLIQSEKMASLGELTAGIAHEIQNPLNFVNNFSETNAELLEEAKAEFKTGNAEEGFHLLNDIQENEKKINFHGRRADSIVKGMLEHSRTSKGEKQPTDLNALVDEYLRLAYHGMRAKDKGFEAKIETHLDNSIQKINIVPQDIGRVLLNLFNNAFYAVNEKKKSKGDGYEPTLSVSTKRVADKIVISVQDNGMGISKSIVDKIFQPFFTTKPTGQGTGLGLSLSYDIVKAHRGELKVESTEGEGAIFYLMLPIT